MKNIIRIPFFVALVFVINACSKGSGETGTLEPDNSTASAFKKNVLIMEFVSFDCVYCPNVSNLLEEASDKYSGRIDLISVHGRLENDDPMEFKDYKKFQNYFYGVTGYPGVIIDQRDDLVTVGTFDASGASFTGRLNAQTSIGIGLKTTIIGDNTVRIETLVSNKGKSGDDLTLAVAVVENDINYKQAIKVNESLQWIESYRHNTVLRSYLSENYFGDPIGTLTENGTYSKIFNYTIPTGVKKENLVFVAYVVETKGFSARVALNSRSVEIGKSIDFPE